MEVHLWRDHDQERHGEKIIWVLLVVGNLIKETLNRDDPHTDPVTALLFADAAAKELNATLRPVFKEV
jgi:hypothetical protein